MSKKTIEVSENLQVLAEEVRNEALTPDGYVNKDDVVILCDAILGRQPEPDDYDNQYKGIDFDEEYNEDDSDE